MPLRHTPSKDNFGNPPWPSGKEPQPPQQPAQPHVDLRRIATSKTLLGSTLNVEQFELLRPISYRISDDDQGRHRRVMVPNPDQSFTTDLTSVPRLFTWLVPKSGPHLPAALIHDGLVVGQNEKTYQILVTDGNGAEIVSQDLIDRIDADSILRNGMHDQGVWFVRRWIVWAAVANASLFSGARHSSGTVTKWYYRIVIPFVFGLIAYLGGCATLDVLDITKREQLPTGLKWLIDVELPLIDHIPKMGGLPTNLPWIDEDASFWLEVLQGLSAAVVIPMVLSILWLRYYGAGAIAGVALATLFHVTLAVAVVALVYVLAELVAKNWVVRVCVGGAAMTVAVVVFLQSL